MSLDLAIRNLHDAETDAYMKKKIGPCLIIPRETEYLDIQDQIEVLCDQSDDDPIIDSKTAEIMSRLFMDKPHSYYRESGQIPFKDGEAIAKALHTVSLRAIRQMEHVVRLKEVFHSHYNRKG